MLSYTLTKNTVHYSYGDTEFIALYVPTGRVDMLCYVGEEVLEQSVYTKDFVTKPDILEALKACGWEELGGDFSQRIEETAAMNALRAAFDLLVMRVDS